MSRWRTVPDDDGSVAIVMSLTIVVFLSLLAVVIDVGQLFAARVLLTAGTDAATLEAAQILAERGCSDFDVARTAAADKIDAHSPTAVMTTFDVTYGAVVVDDVTDCLLVVSDENVGRVDVGTRDTRPFSFAGFFTTNEGSTAAASAAQWGYVRGLSGRVRPLSLCGQNAAYLDYQQYLADRAAFEADLTGLVPPPDPALLDPFDIEIDGFQGSPCEYPATWGGAAQFGEFVLVDFGGDANPASQAELRRWMLEGAPEEVLLDDPATGADEAFCPEQDNDVLGACEGVTQSQSLDRVSDFTPVLGHTFSIMVHQQPVCDNGAAPPNFNHCDGGARGHRSYRVDDFARVRVLCLRISARDNDGNGVPDTPSPVSSADGLPFGFCDDLEFVTNDGNPGDDVFVRLQFVVDGTIQESRLSSDPAFSGGFVGLNLCKVDGDDKCGF